MTMKETSTIICLMILAASIFSSCSTQYAVYSKEMFLVKAEFKSEEKENLSGLKFAIDSENFNLQLLGNFNVLNAL